MIVFPFELGRTKPSNNRESEGLLREIDRMVYLFPAFYDLLSHELIFDLHHIECIFFVSFELPLSPGPQHSLRVLSLRRGFLQKTIKFIKLVFLVHSYLVKEEESLSPTRL